MIFQQSCTIYTGFSLLGGWGESLPSAKNLLIPHMEKFPLVDSQGVILEIESSNQKIQKGHFFTTKKLKKGNHILTSPYVHSIFTTVLSSPQSNNNFHVITHKNFIFSCSHCSCTIFILNSYSLYTQGHADFDFNQCSLFTESCFKV